MSVDSESALQLRNVRKHFGGVKAVSDVSFSVPRGSLTGLIGSNGAGKTTTLNIVSRYIDPDAGTVERNGVDLVSLKPHEVAQLGVGRTFQTPQIFEELTVRENVMVGAAEGASRGHLARFTLGTPGSRRLERELRSRADRWLGFVGLDGEGDQPPASLPFGSLRLLEIARAAAGNPDLLLLDEPSSGLSTAETTEFRGLLDRLRERGTTILLVEHNMRLVMAAATHIVVLDQGTKLAEGPPAEIQRNPAVQRAYLGEPGS